MPKVKKEDVAEKSESTEKIEKTSNEGLTVAERVLEVTGYDCVNQNKLDRVVYGDETRDQDKTGGLGEDADSWKILAHYDRIAGFIKKDGIKVKTGSFWNFARGVKAPHKTPQVLFIYNINGDKVEVDDPSKLGVAMATIENAQAKKAQELKAKKDSLKSQNKF